MATIGSVTELSGVALALAVIDPGVSLVNGAITKSGGVDRVYPPPYTLMKLTPGAEKSRKNSQDA